MNLLDIMAAIVIALGVFTVALSVDDYMKSTDARLTAIEHQIKAEGGRP